MNCSAPRATLATSPLGPSSSTSVVETASGAVVATGLWGGGATLLFPTWSAEGSVPLLLAIAERGTTTSMPSGPVRSCPLRNEPSGTDTRCTPCVASVPCSSAVRRIVASSARNTIGCAFPAPTTIVARCAELSLPPASAGRECAAPG